MDTLCIQQKCDESALFVQQIDVANEIKFRSCYMMFVYHCNNPECHVRTRFDREPSRIPVQKNRKAFIRHMFLSEKVSEMVHLFSQINFSSPIF